MDRGELSLYINGVDKGIAFTGMRGKGALYPAVEAGSIIGRSFRANFNVPVPMRH